MGSVVGLRSVLLCLTAAAGVSALWPYHPFNPHIQNWIMTQLDYHHPRNEWSLRALYQDAETRCSLRLWRLSLRGALNCEKEEDCEGEGVACREIQVCKKTSGKLCWAKESDGGPCKEDKDCLDGHCSEELEMCTQEYLQHGESTTAEDGTSEGEGYFQFSEGEAYPQFSEGEGYFQSSEEQAYYQPDQYLTDEGSSYSSY